MEFNYCGSSAQSTQIKLWHCAIVGNSYYINLLSPSETVAEGGLSVRMKYHVYSVLANIGAALPCISNWSSGLPRVTGQSGSTVITV